MSHFRGWQVKWWASGRQFSLGSWHPSRSATCTLTPCNTVKSCSAMVFFFQQNCRCTYRGLDSGALSRSASGFVHRGINIPYQFRCNSCTADMQEDKAQRLKKVWSFANSKVLKIYHYCLRCISFSLGASAFKVLQLWFEEGVSFQNLVYKIWHSWNGLHGVCDFFCFNSSKNCTCKTRGGGIGRCLSFVWDRVNYWADVSWDVGINPFGCQ